MLKWSITCTLQSEVDQRYLYNYIITSQLFQKTLKPYAFEIVLEQCESLVLVVIICFIVITCFTKYSLSGYFYFFITFMLTNPHSVLD